MTKVQTQVKLMIDRLLAMFPTLGFSYMHDHRGKQHIIDVQPKELANSDEFILAAADEISDFLNKYPNEGILFLSDDPYIKIDKPLYTKVSEPKTKPGLPKLANSRYLGKS